MVGITTKLRTAGVYSDLQLPGGGAAFGPEAQDCRAKTQLAKICDAASSYFNFIAVNELTGHGRCQFTAQAFADLDDDALFSTDERSGAGDQQGVNAAIGLYVDQEVE